MSRKSLRLEMVSQVFARRELDFARRLGEFQSQLDQARAQLRQLRDHRDRHGAVLRASFATDLGRLQNQQAFQNRLNEAISQQELLIQRAMNERNQMRQRWLARHRKTKSVEKLCEKRRADERHERDVWEQKELDERNRPVRDIDVDSIE